ncbi:MAG: hypothetical protein PVJ77_16070, partial [Desulfobacterales bacterium]
LRVCNYELYCAETTFYEKSPMVSLKDGVNFAMLFTLRESRRTSDPALSRDCGKTSTASPLTP